MSASLADLILAGDHRAIARGLSIIVDDEPGVSDLLERIHPRSGRAHLIGVTGPPGAGKSTLVDRLVTAFRQQGRRVGVLAVDPTSPFTGGAILGDRVRMQAHASDDGVFIRSLATRGHLGGLTSTTGDAATLLDAAGFDTVIIETVGVGQAELEVADVVDVSIVLAVPGAGDDVQALKAGLLEIADIFVVNKSDHEGADRTVAALEMMLSLSEEGDRKWRPPIVKTVATAGTGLSDLSAAIDRHRAETASNAPMRRHGRAAHAIRAAFARAFVDRVGQAELDRYAGFVSARAMAPRQAAAALVAQAMEPASPSRGQLRVDHVGIAVSDVAPLLQFLTELGAAAPDPPEVVADQGVSVRFVPAVGASLELLEPTGASSALARFLEKRGPGLHHLAFAVPDLEASMAALAAKGIRFIDQAPRSGARGTSIAFIHPSSAGGVLVELVARRKSS